MADERELIAHVLRRTSFGPFPGQVDSLSESGAAGAVEAALAAEPLDPGSTPDFNENNDGPPRHWLALMARPEASLHEKMTWFWHGHLTSSYDKIGDWRMLWRQHLLLRAHALGNFRELLQAITLDPAMLIYLDGNGSTAGAPNENYGRELMELFSLGRGNYAQADVRAAAVALGGWSVDWDHARAQFDASVAAKAPVPFLGRSVRRAKDVVNAVCDHPACAPFIAGKVHRYLTGVRPDDARRAALGDLFAGSGLEIRPLVEAVLRDASFLELRRTRPRDPVEWVTAAVAALGLKHATAYDACSSLAQLPFYPPNVAGWPPGPRWLSASYAVAEAGLVVQAGAVADVRDADDPVTSALERCSIYEPTTTTRGALDAAADALSRADPAGRATVLLGLAVTSPEFALA